MPQAWVALGPRRRPQMPAVPVIQVGFQSPQGILIRITSPPVPLGATCWASTVTARRNPEGNHQAFRAAVSRCDVPPRRGHRTGQRTAESRLPPSQEHGVTPVRRRRLGHHPSG